MIPKFPELAPLAREVAARLGINEASVKARLHALAAQLMHSLELSAEQAAARLIDDGIDRVTASLAHGPHEQARAMMMPEEISPPAPDPEEAE